MPCVKKAAHRTHAVETFRNFFILAIASSLLLFVTIAFGQEVARVYPATPGEPVSRIFKVSIDGQESPTYLAKVGTPANFTDDRENLGQAAFTSFDIQDDADVTVSYSRPVAAAKVLPTSSGIVPDISGNRISFTVSQPGQLTLEINGDWKNSLHLFVNPFENNVPSPEDPHVVYFKPGIYRLNNITVSAGQTVYLAPGAILYANPGQTGPLFNLNGSNITLRGRGIIDGSAVPHGEGNLIYAYHKSNIQVEGVTLRDSSSWSFHLFNSQNVQISNIKVFGWRLNSDGIDIDSSRNVSLNNSFFRTYDDEVVVKTNNTNGIGTSNIMVSRCVIWNQIAHAFTLGSELLAPVHNVTFSDSDIIHDKGRMALLAVYNGDSGAVENINWSNIRIEEAQRLISVSIPDLRVSQTSERGHVANIVFSDIVSPLPQRSGPNVDLEGYDNTHAIDGVQFQNVTIGSTALQTGDISQNQFVSGITVTP